MNRDKYTEKCQQILNTNQFVKLNLDPTKTTERKVQNVLGKIESKFWSNEYKQLYSTGSSPGKFYGTAKIHKLSQGDQVEKLPIRPIFFIIDTAIYPLAIHLANLLSPSSTSEYTVKSTKDFIEQLRTIKAPKGYQMVSFDVKALFTKEPLEYTIDLVQKRIYENHEISA